MRKLIVLRPQSNLNTTLRLGLFTREFRECISEQEVERLYVDFGEGEIQLECRVRDLYVHYGSIICNQVFEWLTKKQYTNKNQLLLFELTMEDNAHHYRFIGDIDAIDDIFQQARKRLRC